MRTTLLLIFIVISSNALSHGLKEKEIRTNLVDYQLKLDKLIQVLDESFILFRDWVFIDRASNTPSKVKLKYILDKGIIDSTYRELLILKYFFPSDLFDKLLNISTLILTVQSEEKYISEQLINFESYDDPFVIFDVRPRVELGGSIDKAISDTKANIKVLKEYCTFLLNHKKVKPIIESNRRNQDKRQLIVQLFDIIKIRDELMDNMTYLSTQIYLYNEEDKLIIQNGMFKLLIDYFDKIFSEEEIKELFEFYSSPIGRKIIESEGVLSIKLIDSIIKQFP